MKAITTVWTLTYSTSFDGVRKEFRGLMYAATDARLEVVDRSPIDQICEEIEEAMGSGFFYLALSVSLSLPNICAALTSPVHAPSANSDAYKAWVRDHLLRFISYTGLTEAHVYGLRCGVPHPAIRANAMTFTDKDGQTIKSIDAVQFCRDIMTSAKVWLADNRDHPNVAANLQNVVRYRGRGTSSVTSPLEQRLHLGLYDAD